MRLEASASEDGAKEGRTIWDWPSKALVRGGVGNKRTGPGWSSLSLGGGGGDTVGVITRGPVEAPFPLFLLASLLCPCLWIGAHKHLTRVCDQRLDKFEFE